MTIPLPPQLPPDLPAHFFSSLFKRSQDALDFGDNWEDDSVDAMIAAGTRLDEKVASTSEASRGPAFLLEFNPIDRVTRKKGKVLFALY